MKWSKINQFALCGLIGVTVAQPLQQLPVEAALLPSGQSEGLIFINDPAGATRDRSLGAPIELKGGQFVSTSVPEPSLNLAIIPNLGYELYFQGNLVSGPDAADYSWQQAQENCEWNMKTKPNIAIRCVYNGKTFRERPLKNKKRTTIYSI